MVNDLYMSIPGPLTVSSGPGARYPKLNDISKSFRRVLYLIVRAVYHVVVQQSMLQYFSS